MIFDDFVFPYLLQQTFHSNLCAIIEQITFGFNVFVISHIPLCVSIFATTNHIVLCVSILVTNHILLSVSILTNHIPFCVSVAIYDLYNFHFQKKNFQTLPVICTYVLILFEFLWLFHLYLSLWVLNSLISTILTQKIFMIIIFIFSGFVIFCLSVLYCFPCQAYIPDDLVVSPCPVSLIHWRQQMPNQRTHCVGVHFRYWNFNW